jgi:hypothetical protein
MEMGACKSWRIAAEVIPAKTQKAQSKTGLLLICAAKSGKQKAAQNHLFFRIFYLLLFSIVPENK